MTDEELTSILAKYPSFDEYEHQEMTDDQFHQIVRSLSGKFLKVYPNGYFRNSYYSTVYG